MSSDEVTPGMIEGPAKFRRIPVPTIVLAIILTVFGFTLIFQSSRWSRTPSYGNLLRIFSADTWGFIYLAVGILLFLSVAFYTVRMLGVMSHTFAFVLLLGWEVAFIIRYATDQSTTIVNVMSWLNFLFVLLLSSRYIDRGYSVDRTVHDRTVHE